MFLSKKQSIISKCIALFNRLLIGVVCFLLVACQTDPKEPISTNAIEIVPMVEVVSAPPSTLPMPTSPQKTEPETYHQYQIMADVDPIARRVSGVEQVTYKNTSSNPLAEVFFHLYLNAFELNANMLPYSSAFEDKIFLNGKDYGYMNVLNVTIDGKNVDFTILDTILTVKLSEPLLQNQTVDISLVFEAYVPQIAHRTGANENTIWFGSFFPILCVYDEDGWHKEPYYPVGDPFYSEISNYVVKITTPLDYMVAGTGEETTTTIANKKVTTLTAKMVRDFAFATSNTFELKTIKTSQGIYINFYYQSGLSNVDELLDIAKRSFACYDELVGSYPYTSFDIIEIDLYMGGMHYPELTFMDSARLRSKTAKKILIHEIAHQCFYNVVGNNPITQAWVDEGLTSYLQLFVENSQEEIEQQMEQEYQQLAEKLVGNQATYGTLQNSIALYNDWKTYESIQYTKAKLMFHALQEKMGTETFHVFLKTYYAKHAFQTVTDKELIETAEDVYGASLGLFFDKWLNQYELPVL